VAIFIPIHPETIEVAAPTIKAPVVKNYTVPLFPTVSTATKMTRAKTPQKIVRNLYS